MLVPKLRFPEFQEDFGWGERKLVDVLREHGSKSTGKEDVFSVSVHKGIINQIEHLGRSFSAATTDHYKRVLPGDVVYTKSPTGDFPYGIIKQSKITKPVIVSPLYGVFTPETNALGCILDAYFESPENTSNYLSSIVQKGAKNTINISNDTFLSKGLFLPLNKAEQQKIATFLTNFDTLISAESEKLKALQAHKKGLMQVLFPVEEEKVPQVRFQEFEGEWEEKTLGEICQMQAGKFVSASDIFEKKTEELFPCYGGNGLRGYTKTFTHTGNYSLIGRQGALCGNVTFVTEKFHATEHALVVSNSKTIDTNWLFYLLNFLNLNQFATGQAQPGLSVDNLEKVEVKIPRTKEEQQKITACLNPLDTLLVGQSEKINALKRQKSALMQRLFTAMNSND